VLLLGLAALASTLNVVGADPAAADGAGPTNFESVVDSVDPAPPTVQVEVVGGDSFLQVSAERGTRVEIPGYDGEPYLRIAADGTVERNELSPATFLNASRDGSGSLPDRVDSDAEPRWVELGDDGRVAWHDHRIHWMSTSEPPVDDAGVVQPWLVPIVVDGAEVQVTGRLLRHDDVLPWAVGVAIVTAIGAGLLARRSGARVPLLGAVAVVALALAVTAYLVDPPGAGTSFVPILLPALALVFAFVALLAPRVVRGPALTLAAVATLAGWTVGRLGGLWMPVVPTEAPVWVDRAGTALVLGVAVGVAVAVLVRPDARRALAPVADPPAGQRSSGRSPSAQSDMPPRS
jgi:hypothetical protein